MSRRAALTLLLALPPAACTSLPPVPEEVRIGRQVADSMVEQVGVYQDPALDAWLEDLGDRLAARLTDSPYDYEFAILDQPEPNAFAAPGGFVFVSRGLLAVAGSEDEIAAVLGHEMTHVERRHSMQQMRRDSRPRLLTIPGNLIGAVISEDLGNFINSPFDAVAELRAAGYSRDQEREADELGQQLAAEAGYNPGALATVLDDMDALLEQLLEEKPETSYFDSHPPTPERTERILKRAATLQPGTRPAGALDPQAFHDLLDGMVWGANPALGVLDGDVLLKPTLGVALKLPVGWDFVQTPLLSGAVKPDGATYVFYGDAGPGDLADLDSLVRAQRENMERQTGLRPATDEEREFEDGRKARVLIYTNGKGKKALHTFFVFVPMRGRIHRLLGVGLEADRQVIRDVVQSLRPMRPDELLSLRVQRVRATVARAGESLADIAGRSGNVVDVATLAALNGLHQGGAPQPGQPLKIVVEEPLLRPRGR